MYLQSIVELKQKHFNQQKLFPLLCKDLNIYSHSHYISILTMLQISRNAHEILEDLHVINHPTDKHEEN